MPRYCFREDPSDFTLKGCYEKEFVCMWGIKWICVPLDVLMTFYNQKTGLINIVCWLILFLFFEESLSFFLPSRMILFAENTLKKEDT